MIKRRRPSGFHNALTIGEYQDACARSLNLARDRRDAAIERVRQQCPPVTMHAAHTLAELERRVQIQLEPDVDYWQRRLLTVVAMTEDRDGNWVENDPGPSHTKRAHNLCERLREKERA